MQQLSTCNNYYSHTSYGAKPSAGAGVLLLASFHGRCRKLGLQAVATTNKARVESEEEAEGDGGGEEVVTMAIEAPGEDTRGVEGEVRVGEEAAEVEEKKALTQVSIPF